MAVVHVVFYFLEIVAIILVDVLSECVCFYYVSGSFLFYNLGADVQ